MTNENIILNARFELMRKGVLKGTGKFVIVEDENGKKVQLEEPEEIHTYRGWKALSRQVKRGEKAIATIPIWKHTSKKINEEDEQPQEKLFLTNAFFFMESQTETTK